jgi:tetratricopeptide (TPR) repeat protein
MQAKQFWPPTEHKFLYANFVVYGAILVLVSLFFHELTWSKKTLYGYLVSDNIPPSEDRRLMNEAIKLKQQGRDINSIQPLLESAVQIEPYSEARIFLGYCYLSNGDYNEALTCFEKYREINPYFAGLYKDIIDVLEKKQDNKAIEQLLAEGIQNFRRRIELYEPHYDANVPEPFNKKSFFIYKDAQDGLVFLQELQKQSNVSK